MAASPPTREVRTLIRVISLATATSRRERFEQRARDVGVEWDFLDAYTSLHSQLTYTEENALIGRGRPLQDGEIGCYSSHYEAWLSLMASNADQLIVLEDDVVVDWRYLSELAKTNFAGKGIHYLRLFAKRCPGVEHIDEDVIPGDYRVIRIKGYAYGTQGYILTRSGAERFLDHCRTIHRPIDDAMDRSWDHGIPNRSVFPFPVLEEFVPSTISEVRKHRIDFPRDKLFKRRMSVNLDRLRYYFMRHLTGRGKRDPIGAIELD